MGIKGGWKVRTSIGLCSMQAMLIATKSTDYRVSKWCKNSRCITVNQVTWTITQRVRHYYTTLQCFNIRHWQLDLEVTECFENFWNCPSLTNHMYTVRSRWRRRLVECCQYVSAFRLLYKVQTVQMMPQPPTVCELLGVIQSFSDDL